LQLGPNAVHALMSLNAADDVRRFAVAPVALTMRRARDGVVLARMPLGAEMEARHGAPYWVVHRADLRAGLLARVAREPTITVSYGAEVVGIEKQADGVAVTLSDGRCVTGRALVGADGVWSRVRATVVPDAQPQQSGYVAYRAVVPVAAGRILGAIDEVGAWLRPDAHLVHYPVRGRDAINVVLIVASTWVGDTWSGGVDRAEVAPILSRFSPDIARALGDVDWLKWALAASVKLPRWSDGSVVLVGDAAHGMLPFLAQGAGMALEDAVTLGAAVGANPDDLTRAFASYVLARRPRIARVQDGASRNGKIFHLDGAMAAARDMTLRLLPTTALIARMDWLYGYRP
jgi:salicylate hydroxylase